MYIICMHHIILRMKNVDIVVLLIMWGHTQYYYEFSIQNYYYKKYIISLTFSMFSNV